MEEIKADSRIVSELMTKLLPMQIAIAAVASVDVIVSAFFAGNYIGVNAMSVVGLYAPIKMLISALSTILVGGAVIICSRSMGSNDQKRMQNVFSLSVVLAIIVSLILIVVFLLSAILDLTTVITQDEIIRSEFNTYLLGQCIGLMPFMIGAQLAAFLSIENKDDVTLVASITYIAVLIVLNLVFVVLLNMGVLGLALASSLGMMAYLIVELRTFMAGKSIFHFAMSGMDWSDSSHILLIGMSGALSNLYQSIRGLIVNRLLEAYVGTVAISAFVAVDNTLRIVWAIPIGMLSLSRILISVSIGEEDRTSLMNIMRGMFKRYVPFMAAVSLLIIILAVPLTRIYYRDPATSVYMMTVWGFRILPLCMPLSIIMMHFTCYGQASNKLALVHTLSLLDGVVCVALFTALLIPYLGVSSVYLANILNGIVCVIAIVIYSMLQNRKIPRDMDELMVIPKEFGASEDDRMDISIRNIDEVVTISRKVQEFCISRGIDQRRAYLSGLAMEEMAGNIVDHGFNKDKKEHSIDARVVRKNNDVILRLRDDCVPFNPGDRVKLTDSSDPSSNIGIRMILTMARDVRYQNILGMNVLTIRT